MDYFFTVSFSVLPFCFSLRGFAQAQRFSTFWSLNLLKFLELSSSSSALYKDKFLLMLHCNVIVWGRIKVNSIQCELHKTPKTKIISKIWLLAYPLKLLAYPQVYMYPRLRIAALAHSGIYQEIFVSLIFQLGFLNF